MRTLETTVYTLTELPEDIQEKAWQKDQSAGDNGYIWDDAKGSMDAFIDIFPVKVRDYSIGGRGSHISFEMTCDDDIENLTGQRLATYIWNNYRDSLYKGKWFKSFSRPASEDRIVHRKLRHSTLNGGPNKGDHWYEYRGLTLDRSCVMTGMCYDESILGPVYKFLDRPDANTSFDDLMNECFEEFRIDIENEIEYRESFEAFKEDAEANDWEFTETGDRI